MKNKAKARVKAKAKKTIVFLHPDLGIGGAERLVVDAAVGLQNRGHKVVIFTSHCDPAHCFDEARDGTLDVRVRGNTLVPPSILSRFSILCAILRQLHLILQIHLGLGLGFPSSSSSEIAALAPDAYFVDQLSAGLPLLQLLLPRPPARARVFFYCHFPDLLLARGRERWWKRAWRAPFDAWERWSMGFADAVAVNSDFTRQVVAETWPGLVARQKVLHTVYPCVDVDAHPPQTTTTTKTTKAGGKGEEQQQQPLWKGTRFVLSINRFERKKDIALAIRAFAGLPAEGRCSSISGGSGNGGVRLAVAGGYDPRVAENVAYHRELVQLAESLGLRCLTVATPSTAHAVPADVDVVFLHNVTHVLKALLLGGARLLAYTPAREHFGIVPLEAMLAGVPVLAADTGGPVETVVEGDTGWLRDPARVDDWTSVMDVALNRLAPPELERMSRLGVARVREGFGQAQMAERLDGILDEALAAPSVWTDPPSRASLLLWAAWALCILVGAVAVAGRLLLPASEEGPKEE
ncbi:glycosyltransferase family 4 protein [Xylariaceae sp. FL0804]|nr:glycosyltransferase family 4 protein [Xylariaceae sp. FL0804]